MKKLIALITLTLFLIKINAQQIIVADTLSSAAQIIITKDPRLDILAKQEIQFNKNTVGYGNRVASGYRLLILSTNDRNYAMKVRTTLLQRFPEQKVYMSFQAPFIKLKFGNFINKAEADNYKKNMMTTKIVTNNIYIVPELIELKIKPDKNKETDDN